MPGLRNEFVAKEGNFLEIITKESFRADWVDEASTAFHKLSTVSTYDPTTGRRDPNFIERGLHDEKLVVISNEQMLDVIEYDLGFIIDQFGLIDPKDVKPIEDMDANIGDLLIFEAKEKSMYNGAFPGGYLMRNNIPRKIEIGNYSPRDLKTGKIRHPGFHPRNWPKPRTNQKTIELNLNDLTGRYITLRAYQDPFKGQLGHKNWTYPTPISGKG